MTLAQNHQQLLNGNKLKIKILFLFILLFTLNNISAQYAEVLKKEDGVFYIHTVEDGNSIYGIQRWYGCSIDDLLKANPGIERGLTNGTVVYVPVVRKTISHVVEKQETLFKLSRMYDVSVDSIIAQNPSTENGLKIDQKLSIRNAVPRIVIAETINPEPILNATNVAGNVRLTFSDSVVEHTVLPQENMYTIAKRFMIPVQRILEYNQLNSTKINAGQKLKIPLKKENLSPVPTRTPVKITPLITNSMKWGEKLPQSPKIAILLPLNLDSLSEVNKSVSNFGLDFYIGAQMALDSLEREGYSASVKIIDYYQKGKSFIDIVASEKLSSYDLIFAPFDKKEAELLHNWSLGKQIYIVYPTSVSPTVVKKNPFALTYSTTNEQLIMGMAKYCRTLPGRIVVIKNEKTDENWMQNIFSSTFRNESKNSDSPLIEATLKNYKQFEQIGGPIYYVFLSTEKEKVLPLLTSYQTSENFKVIGLKDWTEWKEVNATIKNKFTFLFAAPNQFEYDDESIKLFHKKFRNSKQADLTKTVCLGYDVTKNVLSYSWQKQIQEGVISFLSPTLRNETDGFENAAFIPVIFEQFKTRNLLKP
jgi:LysM repeat protein